MDADGDGMGLDLAMRALDFNHMVRYWLPPHVAGELPYGEGLVQRPEEWEPSMDWAELIVIIGNSKYQARLAEYFGRGYPIFGTCVKAAELELDREKGQEVLDRYGVSTLPFTVVSNASEAIAHITRTGKPYAIKPWGGAADKSTTYVGSNPEDAIFTLDKWQSEGKVKGQLMLQEKADGIEMGVSAFFGPGGWSKWIEESWEHKKFLVGDLGCNTGEMGTVIRHVKKSRLFDLVLEPVTPYLQLCGFVGDCSVNCIVDESGQAWPLEFTVRLGWPDFCIRQELIEGDPVGWMLDLLEGVDSFDPGARVAAGLVMTHGDFPRDKDPLGTWQEYPIRGTTDGNWRHLHWQQVMEGDHVSLKDGTVRRRAGIVTAGNYPLVVTGQGDSVSEAAGEARKVADKIRWPSNVMYRTDIGKRLKKELPVLQALGFAMGMTY